MKDRSCRVYFVTHSDGRKSGILLRRWGAFFDKPPPAAYGPSEEDVLCQLDILLQERLAEDEELARYLWNESFQIYRAAVTIHPQTLVKKQPVIGMKRIPLQLTYVACKLESGAYRVMLPRFGWWMVVEDLSVAAETLRNAVSAALLGGEPRWLYDFRREGEEYVKTWTPEVLARGAVAAAPADSAGEYPVLAAIAEELVDRAARRKLPPVVGEDPSLKSHHESLRRFPPPSLLLVGPPGCGKSTWVRRVARLFAAWRREGARVPRVWRTSGERIIAGMVYLGMWQQRVYDLVEELRHEGDYLYVDRLGSILRRQSDGACIADLLLPALQAEEISLLAECSEAELEHYQRQAPSLINLLQIIRLDELSPAEMPALLAQYQTLKAPAARIHPEGLTRLVRLLDAFVRTARFPGKGFHFLDWLAQQEQAATMLYPRDVETVFSRYTGLPVELISDEQPLPAARIADRLREAVVGQDAACGLSGALLARFKARLNDPERPLGTLLFVGPTGVGKTELAKQLARFLFGDETRLVRLDMSEYMSGASSLRLLEVGHGAGSLAEQIRQQPLSLVLLDEIEKAHPQVFDLLLGVLGEGRMTDAGGRLVDFRSSLIVMTSNLGAAEGTPAGFGERHQEGFLRAVRQHFRPEFFNRLDHVVTFRHLEHADLLRIVDLELRKAAARVGLQRRRIRLRVDDGARQLLARLGFHPTRGARPLKRVIEERVMVPLAVRIAAEPSLADREISVVSEGSAAFQKLGAAGRQAAIVLAP